VWWVYAGIRGGDQSPFTSGWEQMISLLELSSFYNSDPRKSSGEAQTRGSKKVYCGTISNIRLEQSAPFRHLSLMHGVLLDGLSSCPRSLTVGSSVCNGDGCVPVFFRGGAPPPRKGLFQPQPNNLAQ
jgi:hypothetical protein